jgi:hypothetical protein
MEGTRKMNNQTIQNDPADRSDEAKNELQKQLRSIWQGWQAIVQTLDVEEFEKVLVQEMRELLDG